jgi:ABC-2 type transport system ATP-binding protein
MADTAIEVNKLTKTYSNNVQAVKGVNFIVKLGEFFAFLGPNGAGKSSVIKMLATLMKPSSGQARIGGCDLLREPGKIRMKIGVALQNTAIDPELTGREMVILQGTLYGLSTWEARRRAGELLELVNLAESADRPCGKYSGGMQRRLDLALTLVHRPEILFLDEPTTGLDPESRRDLWKEIRKHNQEYGTTIFLTTQYLEEADQVADGVCIIQNGLIIATGKPHELKRSIALEKIFLCFASPKEQEQAQVVLADLAPNMEPGPAGLNLYLEDGRKYLPLILQRLAQAQLYPRDIGIVAPTLDDVFLQVTRRRIHSSQREVEEGDDATI